MTSAFLPSLPATLSCALRIAEVTSTHSHEAGRAKENSPTLNVFGASAATANIIMAAKQKAENSTRIWAFVEQSRCEVNVRKCRDISIPLSNGFQTVRVSAK